jgi:hypothetical protein
MPVRQRLVRGATYLVDYSRRTVFQTVRRSYRYPRISGGGVGVLHGAHRVAIYGSACRRILSEMLFRRRS